ncbi:MAG: lysophospholipid acyltransferase family protein [Candidatus Omnitrophica bacterium]|nr:lysophospholipid acyltransferase family protein [Candidatus Omnitrophota bacterium]
MKSTQETTSMGFLGIVAFIFRILPLSVSFTIGRLFGRIGYYAMPKKRALVYANLKTVFCKDKSPAQLRYLTRRVFIHLTQSFVEMLCMRNMKRSGFDKFVQIQGREHIDEAMRRGKGAVFLAIHSGNWEIGSIFNSLTGYTYNVVANKQPKMPELAVLLNECRRLAGAHVIDVGSATKEIISALKRNEIVGLVLDQGGQEGVIVDFLGTTASMSSGAIRLALKYGCALCPAWMVRQSNGRHILEFLPPVTLIETGNFEEDIKSNVQKVALHFEARLRQYPEEYLWFYKVFKYTSVAQILILEDNHSKNGQPLQEALERVKSALVEEGKTVKDKRVSIHFRSTFMAKLFSVHGILSRFFSFFRQEDHLRFFLTESCYAQLMSVKSDFVISCGPEVSGINFILSKNHLARSIQAE